jgi:predicted RNA binding protein YcfA (HicA-like mRNA interferase family)
MTRLPRLTAQEVVRVIERKGFVLVRQSGSHKNFGIPKARG